MQIAYPSSQQQYVTDESAALQASCIERISVKSRIAEGRDSMRQLIDLLSKKME
jgi:hypothetical protein